MPNHIRSRPLLAVVLAVAATVGVAANPAHAAPPAGIHIEVPTLFASDTATFTATGDAVDDGLVCATGTVTTTANRTTGWRSGRVLNFHVDKTFTCPDGSFDVRLSAHLGAGGVTFRWVILGGSGAFDGLSGAGSGVGRPLPDGNPDGVLDICDGWVVAP